MRRENVVPKSGKMINSQNLQIHWKRFKSYLNGQQLRMSCKNTLPQQILLLKTETIAKIIRNKKIILRNVYSSNIICYGFIRLLIICNLQMKIFPKNRIKNCLHFANCTCHMLKCSRTCSKRNCLFFKSRPPVKKTWNRGVRKGNWSFLDVFFLRLQYCSRLPFTFLHFY